MEDLNQDYKLKPWQDSFIFSKKRYPALFSSWGTGKTLSLIMRGMLYSENSYENNGIIFRKEYTDLRDSTVVDFQKYTGLIVNSAREVVLEETGSKIMFRHLEELNNIQNVNLGWFAIEQGDEIESDKEFFTLFGRLRLKVRPNELFKELELPEQSGFVIGNAGDHWGRRVWKDDPIDDSEVFEANTFDNKENLPASFLASLDILKKRSPQLYKKFVLNDWSVGADQYILITSADIDRLQGVTIHVPLDKYIIALDPALGGDECCYKVYKNSIEIDQMILHERDAMKVVGYGMILSQKHKIDDFIIDVGGLGAPIAARFEELGKRVQKFNAAESAKDDKRFGNKKSEAWWQAMEEIQDSKVEYIKDEETRKQLTSTKYRVVKSSGKILMEHKEDTKKRIGRSPDRADTYVMARYGINRIEPRAVINKRKDAYHVYDNDEYSLNPATV